MALTGASMHVQVNYILAKEAQNLFLVKLGGSLITVGDHTALAS